MKKDIVTHYYKYTTEHPWIYPWPLILVWQPSFWKIYQCKFWVCINVNLLKIWNSKSLPDKIVQYSIFKHLWYLTLVLWLWHWKVCLCQFSAPSPSLILLYHTHPSSKISRIKGYFLRKSRICFFLEKGGILVLTSVNLEKKGLILMSSVLYEKGGSFRLKSQCLPQKRGFILDWKVSVLSRKRGRFELKSQCFATKKRVIFKLENKDGYHFFQWVREPGSQFVFMPCQPIENQHGS